MSAPDAAFYFDLASPLAYLSAERILHMLPGPVEWQPVLASRLPGPSSDQVFRCASELDSFREELGRRAEALGLQRLRWPDPFPFDSEEAMRVATYAKRIGRVVAFAQAAFRQAFAGGHSLCNRDFVLIAAAACEMHPRAVLQAGELDSIRDALLRSTELAQQAGVAQVPAVRLGAHVFQGESALEEALAWRSGQAAGKLPERKPAGAPG